VRVIEEPAHPQEVHRSVLLAFSSRRYRSFRA
jgi:hypothetical protein